MSLDPQLDIKDLEQKKFMADTDNNVAVRVNLGDNNDQLGSVDVAQIQQALKTIINYLARPIWLNTTGDLKVAVSSGTVNTVSTLTALGSGSFDAFQGMVKENIKTNWNTSIRGRIV